MERLNLDKVKLMAAAATLAMFAGTACAHVEIYAEVNKAYTQLWAEPQDTGVFTDNNYSPSKLGAMSSAHLTKCVTFGGVTELEFLPNNTRLVNQLQTENLNNHVVLVRKVDAWVSTGMWGKFSLGLGEAASYGITNFSYAGTNETSLGAVVANNAGGMIFAVEGNNALLTNPTVNVVFNALNGIGDADTYNGVLSTKDRVRYDTADWMGFRASVSYGNDTKNFRTYATEFAPEAYTRRTFIDVAVRYTACWDDFMVGAGVAGMWLNRDGVNTELFNDVVGSNLEHESIWSASIAFEHKPTGFNAAAAGGEKDKYVDNLSDYKFWYVQLGKKFCFTHIGKTNFAIDYFWSKNSITNGDRGNSWSVGGTQELHKIHSAVYAAVRSYTYNHTHPDYQELYVMTLGVQFKFGAMM